MKLNSSKASKATETKPSSSFNLVIKERLRQARHSFNIAVKVLSVALILCGTGLSCTGKVSEGAIMTEGGKNLIVISEYLIKQSKEDNDRLDQDLKKEK